MNKLPHPLPLRLTQAACLWEYKRGIGRITLFQQDFHPTRLMVALGIGLILSASSMRL